MNDALQQRLKETKRKRERYRANPELRRAMAKSTTRYLARLRESTDGKRLLYVRTRIWVVRRSIDRTMDKLRRREEQLLELIKERDNLAGRISRITSRG